MTHVPVLLNEALELLYPKPGEFFIDGTSGSGGHTRVLESRVKPDGKVLAIDWDKTRENYADLSEILKKKNLPKADGLLLDLGFSSEQLETGRGFGFAKDEPLLMTYDRSAKPLKEILRKLTEEEIFKIIKDFGEERFAKKIAAAIYRRERRRPMETSGELAEVIRAAAPKNYERGRIDPATRTFQAFRIYVNRELENLEKVLRDLPEIIRSGGRIAIISFHSLEDRLVKNYFRDYAKADQAELLAKKPITASSEEIMRNPRSRSAKLRGLRFMIKQ